MIYRQGRMKNHPRTPSFQMSQSRFNPRLRRPSFSGTVNQMISIQSSRLLNTHSHNFSHFHQNFNKVESNIQGSRVLQPSRSSMFPLTSFRCRKKQPSHGQQGIQNKPKLRELKIGNERRSISKNAKQQIVKKAKLYPRFKILELRSLYYSLVKHSQADPAKFLQAFESSLNFQRIMMKPDVIKKCLYEQKNFSFESFLNAYKRLEDLMFIQSITDYLEIIFQPHHNHPMTRQKVLYILSKRSPKHDADEITHLIFKKLERKQEEGVWVPEILELCEKDLEFSSSLSKLYQQQLKDVN